MEKMPNVSINLSRLLVPDTVYFDITPQCNLRCQHCYSRCENINLKEKTYKEVRNILKQVIKAKIFKIDLVGREPLMREDFGKIIRYISQKGCLIKIASNGTLINPEIAKTFASYNINSVQISIDSVSAEKHNMFRGNNNAFSLAVRGIELLKKHGINACIATTLTNFNFKELKKLADFAYKLGVYYYKTKLLIGNPHNKKFQINKQQYKYTVETLFNLKNHYKNMTVEQLHHSFLFEKNIKYDPARSITIPCGAGISRCSLTYDFKITPCIALAHLYSAPIKKGLVKEWQNNPIFNQWLKTFTLIKGKCGICGYKYVCGGGCRANVFGVTNNIFSSDPWCWFNPKNYK